MKLQELLNKYKNKIWYLDFAKIELSCFENDVDLLCYRYWEFYPDIKPLSWLLFSTPFLSLLEWDDNKCDKVWIHQYMKWWKFVEWYSIYEQYHKINLVLLNTDEERIEYIEDNAL